MREYTRIVQDNLIILVPLGEETPSHGILCSDVAQAHEYKLALGLGTHPDPEKAPGNYDKAASDIQSQFPYPIFVIGIKRDSSIDEDNSGCCESGCPGCPWTLEQIRLSKL